MYGLYPIIKQKSLITRMKFANTRSDFRPEFACFYKRVFMHNHPRDQALSQAYCFIIGSIPYNFIARALKTIEIN